MKKIRIAVVGVGNCASSLIQGIEHYRGFNGDNPEKDLGLMHEKIGSFTAGDIEVVAAFDVDKRKVGLPLGEAVFACPNCTKKIVQKVKSKTTVQMGHVLDGVALHMDGYPEERRFLPAKKRPANVAKILKDSGAEMVLSYLPVGSEQATRFYAEQAIKAGVGLINCMPVFIASNKDWAGRFEEKGLPIIGDDIKSQIGATIIHRALTKLFMDRGVKIDKTYQLNVGGNTDFLNMLDRTRLKSKKISKTAAVQSQLPNPLEVNNIHIGPSDYIPWLNDNKVCFIRMEARIFGNIPVDLELRLSVEDSPNSAGVVIDAVRCMKLALDRGHKGALISPSAYFMKHPPRQFSDSRAREMVEEFISGKRST